MKLKENETDQAFVNAARPKVKKKSKRGRAKTASKKNVYDNDTYDDKDDVVEGIFLREVMDKPYSYDLKTAGCQWVAKFKTDARDLFKIKIDRETYDDDKEDEWNVIFSDEALYDGIGITNKGDQFRVFATVFDVISEFLKKIKPSAFTFAAKEDSRNKLYSMMIKKYAGKLGYELDGTYNGPHGLEYVLTRK